MRQAARTDENQKELVKLFRTLGMSVWITSAMGKGSPDCVIGANGYNVLVEIKDGNKSPSQRRLTPDELKFHQAWKGEIRVIETMDQAINLCNDIRTRSKCF